MAQNDDWIVVDYPPNRFSYQWVITSHPLRLHFVQRIHPLNPPTWSISIPFTPNPPAGYGTVSHNTKAWVLPANWVAI